MRFYRMARHTVIGVLLLSAMATPLFAQSEEIDLNDYDESELSQGENAPVYGFNVGLQAVKAPPTAPAGIRIDNLWPTAVDLRWQDRSNNETGFRVYVRRPSNGGSWTPCGVGANTTTLRINGLTPDTNYDFAVKAFNAAGESAASTISVHTPQSPAAAPSNLTYGHLHQTTVVLYWNDNSNNESGFRIYWRRPDLSGKWYVINVRAGATSFEFNVGFLAPNAPYDFVVKAYNSVGESDGPGVSLRTPPAGRPAAPAGLWYDGLWGSGVNLHWVDTSNNESEFDIFYRRPGIDTRWYTAAVEENATFWPGSIAFLRPNTVYEMYVASCNSYGLSGRSNVISFRTPIR